MSSCKVLNIILQEILRKYSSPPCLRKSQAVTKCDNFLCTSEGLCNDDEFQQTVVQKAHANSIIKACTNILLTVGNSQDILQILLPAIESSHSNWAVCFDRRQVRCSAFVGFG